MARNRTPPTVDEINYALTRLNYDPHTGIITRKPSGKPAIRFRADGWAYVTLGSTRNMSAKDVAWLLLTNEWPPSDTRVRVIQKSETPNDPRELRAENIYLEAPDMAESQAVLERWWANERRLQARENLTGFNDGDEARYEMQRAEAVATLKFACSSLKAALLWSDPGGQLPDGDEGNAAMSNISRAAIEIAEVQGFPAAALHKPETRGVDEWLDYYGRIVRASAPEFRGLPATEVASRAASLPRSPLLD